MIVKFHPRKRSFHNGASNACVYTERNGASNAPVPTNTKAINFLSGRLMVFCLLGVLPNPGNTENFCGYAPIAALKNMTEAAVSYSLCCI